MAEQPPGMHLMHWRAQLWQPKVRMMLLSWVISVFIEIYTTGEWCKELMRMWCRYGTLWCLWLTPALSDVHQNNLLLGSPAEVSHAHISLLLCDQPLVLWPCHSARGMALY